MASLAVALLVVTRGTGGDATFCTTSNAISIVRNSYDVNVPLHHYCSSGSGSGSLRSLSNRRKKSSSRSFLSMYVPHSPITQTPALSSLHAASVVAAESSTAPSDTLPQFKTAHGLLSPRTVLRLEQNFAGNLDTSDELCYFLDTYKEFGPMACIPMLSDPKILPHLTKAMKDSITD